MGQSRRSNSVYNASSSSGSMDSAPPPYMANGSTNSLNDSKARYSTSSEPSPPQSRHDPVPPPQSYVPTRSSTISSSHSTQRRPDRNEVVSKLRTHLNRIVQENGISRFYPRHVLEGVIARLAETVSFQNISSFWEIPLEIAYDLSSLALYDVVIFSDDSGSMRIEEQGTRIDDLRLILERITEVAFQMDDDGVSVRFMNSSIAGDHLKNATEVNSLVDRVTFTGLTPIGTNLHRRVIEPLVFQPLSRGMLKKPVLTVIITDGEPCGEDRGRLKRTILEAAERLQAMGYPRKTIAFTIAQCGKDARAQSFLAELDNDREVGELIDCVSYYELEEEEFARKGVVLTPELYLVKLIVGGIDQSYDEQD
ncbi:hypothetical protein HDU97_006886 [Phlyctochytrium planicorne]|nr:hypothetical protein HDU97_006886 [Phlyctochytrium planicorne]